MLRTARILRIARVMRVLQEMGGPGPAFRASFACRATGGMPEGEEKAAAESAT